MTNIIRLFLTAIYLGLPVPLLAATGDEPNDFHAWIAESYAFAPHELTEAQQAEKSKVLDEVWARVKTRPDPLLVLLRTELARTDMPRFFYFDGSQLLLSLSKTEDDKRTALRAFERCDIRDVVRNVYFYTLRSLAMAGLDVTEAALNILNEEKFEVFVPAHALTLDAEYALIYMLNDVEPAVYVPKLIGRFESETRESAKVAILTALWYSLDPVALAYIDALPAVERFPTDLRTRATDFQQRNHDLRGTSRLNFKSEATLRIKRRETLRRVSDEALSEYEDLTRSLLKKMK